MASESSISSTVAKWLECRQKLDEYTRKVERYRAIVEQHMMDAGLNRMTGYAHDGKPYKITLSTRSRESLSKKDVPPEVWEQYAKASRFRVLLATEEKKAED